MLTGVTASVDAERTEHGLLSARMRVSQFVEDWMRNETPSVGQALPSARAIARHLEVDPRTVNAALASLVDEGVVGRHPQGRRLQVTRRRATGFVARSVLLQSSVDAKHLDAQRARSGWAIHVELGARRRVQELGWHAVLASAEQTSALLPEFGPDMPVGLAVPDPEHNLAALRSLLPQARKAGLPVAVYGDMAGFESFDRVCSDHAAGTALLTEWLIAHGARRPVQLVAAAQRSEPWVEGRLKGYRAACRAAGLEPAMPLELPKLDTDWGNPVRFEECVALLAGYLAPVLTGPRRADALLATSDGHVPLLAAACRRFHLEPNRDVLLTGYDNYWQDSPERRLEPTPPLATIDKRNEELGVALIDLLREHPDKPKGAPPTLRVVAPRLVVTQGE